MVTLKLGAVSTGELLAFKVGSEGKGAILSARAK